MKQTLFALPFLVLGQAGYCQSNSNPERDSLRQQVYISPEDTIKVKKAIQLGVNWATGKANLDSAEVWFQFALHLSTNQNPPYLPGSVDGLNGMCLTRRRQRRLPEAMGYIDRAIEIAEKMGGSSLVKTLSQKGQLYETMGDFGNALFYNNKAMELGLAEKVDAVQMYKLTNALAITYGNAGNNVKSIKYYLKTVELLEKAQPGSKFIIGVYSNICNRYLDLGDLENLEKYARIKLALSGNKEGWLELANVESVRGNHVLALERLERHRPSIKHEDEMKRSNFYGQRCHCLAYLGNFDATRKCLDTLVAIARAAKLPYQEANSYAILATAWEKSGQLDSAEACFLKGIEKAQALSNNNLLKEGYLKLAEFYSRRAGAFEKAYNAYVQYKTYSDSALNVKNVRSLAQSEASLETERVVAKTEREKLQLEKEKQVVEARVKAREAELFAKKTEAEKREILLELLKKEKNLQALSLSEQQSQIEQEQLLSKNQRQEIELLNQNNTLLAQQKALQSEVTARQKNNFLFGAIGSLALLAVLAFWWRNRARLEQVRLRQSALENEKKALESSISRLLAQMNPHFVFNGLNSINSFVMRNEGAEASRYLAQFAELMRMVLDYSAQPKIRLEQEIGFLEKYLALESQRLDGRLDWDIRLAPDVDDYETEIPPMILQPLVENAIWHGISPKTDGRGRILIGFKKEDSGLTCTVEDNGVGLDAVPKKHGHEPKSQSITAERLALFDRQHGTHSVSTLEEITAADGSVAGTRAVLKLGHRG